PARRHPSGRPDSRGPDGRPPGRATGGRPPPRGTGAGAGPHLPQPALRLPLRPGPGRQPGAGGSRGVLAALNPPAASNPCQAWRNCLQGLVHPKTKDALVGSGRQPGSAGPGGPPGGGAGVQTRRWLWMERLLLGGGLVLLLVALAVLGLNSSRLPTRWAEEALARALPGVGVELGSVRLTGLRALEATALRVDLDGDGRPDVRADRVTLGFDLLRGLAAKDLLGAVERVTIWGAHARVEWPRRPAQPRPQAGPAACPRGPTGRRTPRRASWPACPQACWSRSVRRT